MEPVQYLAPSSFQQFRLLERPTQQVVLYDTWIPFLHNRRCYVGLELWKSLSDLSCWPVSNDVPGQAQALKGCEGRESLLAGLQSDDIGRPLHEKEYPLRAYCCYALWLESRQKIEKSLAHGSLPALGWTKDDSTY